MIILSQTLRFYELFDEISKVKSRNYKIELMLDAESIDKMQDKTFLNEVIAVCKDTLVSVHAPSHSLNIGSKDTTIREYSLKRILEGIKIASDLNANDYIFHSTFMPLVPRDVFEKWVEVALPNFKKIIESCVNRDIVPVIENTYEKDIELFERLFNEYKNLEFCLDTGHVYCFSNIQLEEWLEKIGEKISVIHMHDNNEHEDTHDDLCTGIVDFETIIDKTIELEEVRLNLETDMETFDKNADKLEELIR